MAVDVSVVKKDSFPKKGTKEEYKTDTITKRAIYAYLPSMEEGEKTGWKSQGFANELTL